MIKPLLQEACAKKEIIVDSKSLPLSCPTDEMSLWNAHPKVYMSIEKTGEAVCPYCGTRFILKHD